MITYTIICPNCYKITKQEIESYIYKCDIQNTAFGCEDCEKHPAWKCLNCEKIFYLVTNYEDIII